MAQRGVAGTGGEHDLGPGGAHVGGVDDLVRVARLEHAVLVDAGAVREGVCAHDGLVGLHVHARDAADQAGCAGELAGHDVRVGVELVAVHLERHDDLLQRRVARALAQAVDGALHLRGAVLHALQREGRSHAQVVVGVDGDGAVLDADDVVRQALDARAKVLGQLVARGVGDVDDGGARVDGGLHHTDQEVLVRTAGVLRVELDVVHVLLGVLDGVDGALHNLVLRQTELLVNVLGRDPQAGVDARALGRLERLGGAVDVLVDGASQTADHAGVPRQAANLLHGAEVARAGDGEAGLDHVHVHADELLRNDELLLRVHGGAGALLAVAEGGVKDGNLAGHVGLLLSLRPGSTGREVPLYLLRRGSAPGGATPTKSAARRSHS